MQISKPLKITILILVFAFLVISVIVPNIYWIKSPITAPINGKVMNAADGKPVPNLHLVIKCVINYTYFPYHSSTENSDVMLVRTDNDGQFQVGRVLKPLSFTLFPFIYRDYGGQYVFTLDNRYGWAAKEVGPDGKVELRVAKIETIN